MQTSASHNPKIIAPTPASIDDAARLLRSGHLVAFPTETIYGLGANALDDNAVRAIFAAKGRPAINPVIVHVATIEDAQKYAVFSDIAEKLGRMIWPGPLTMILPKRPDCDISNACTAGLDTIAIRIPSHPVAQKLLQQSGVPIAAPSANLSGHVTATTPMHVAHDVGEHVAMILAGGKSDIGLESTIIDMTASPPVIVRSGAITPDDLADIIVGPVTYAEDATKNPKSPGQLLKHYAPSIPVRINAIDLLPGEAILAFGSDTFMGIRGGGAARDLPDTARRNLSPEKDLYQAAGNLYAMLRDLDRPEHIGIAVMAIPDAGIGHAINNRLKRAASGR